MRTSIYFVVLCGAAACSWGCDRGSQPAADAGATEDEIAAAHGIAAHKPHNFAQAVDELGIRFRRIQQKQEADDGPADTELQQLIDIIRWLPEMAADSDLGRADWELVQQQSVELETLTQSWRSQTKMSAGEQSTRFLEIVEKLAPLATRSGTAWDGHRHDDELSTTGTPGAVDSPL